jgi:HEAT repeats/GAF domain
VTANETLLDGALHDALDALGAGVAVVYLRDSDRPVLRLAAARTKSANEATAAKKGAADDGALDTTSAARTKGRGALSPWANEVAWGKGLVGQAAAAAAPLEGDEEGLSGLAAPLLLGDEVMGVLAVASGGRREFGGAHAEALLVRSRSLARALTPEPLEALRSELARRVAAPAMHWLDTIIAAAARGEREAVLHAFPAAGRRLGREPLGSPSALVRRDLDLEVPLRSWRIDDAGRAAFLCAFAGDAEALARDLYFTGDLRERCGTLRALAVIGRAAVALDAVLDACRTSAVELFEAAVADNPYTSRVLPDEAFRNAVLKAAFVGVSIARLPGVEARADEELSRMLLSYVTEREVAGRSVPPDTWPVMALHPTPGLTGKLCGYLEHPAEAHRAAAALALERIGDRRARPFLHDRLARESDPAVRRVLERAMAADRAMDDRDTKSKPAGPPWGSGPAHRPRDEGDAS